MTTNQEISVLMTIGGKTFQEAVEIVIPGADLEMRRRAMNWTGTTAKATRRAGKRSKRQNCAVAVLYKTESLRS